MMAMMLTVMALSVLLFCDFAVQAEASCLQKQETINQLRHQVWLRLSAVLMVVRLMMATLWTAISCEMMMMMMMLRLLLTIVVVQQDNDGNATLCGWC